MAKNKKLYEEKKREVFNTKYTFIKYAKRYGIILLVSLPIILISNYIMSLNISWYKGAVTFFVSFAMLLFALLIGIIIFSKIDDRRRKNLDPEKERDPFAD